MTAETLVNVHEALEYLENLDVSSKDEDLKISSQGKISYFTFKKRRW